jgi:hypothetical protein
MIIARGTPPPLQSQHERAVTPPMHDKNEKRRTLAGRGFRATTSEPASPTHRPQQATEVCRETAAAAKAG